MMHARCRCGNGVFIVTVKPHKDTDKKIDVRYECTICPSEVVFEIPRDDAQAFCDGLGGKFGEEDDDEATDDA